MTGTPPRAPTRVLLVEDHDLVASAMTILLESGGHEVRCAPTVAEGFEAVSTWRPDVTILDLTLPDGHGLDLLARLHDAGLHAGAVLALTGHDDDATTARCREAGCREVLLKPVPARELLGIIARWAPTGTSDAPDR